MTCDKCKCDEQPQKNEGRAAEGSPGGAGRDEDMADAATVRMIRFERSPLLFARVREEFEDLQHRIAAGLVEMIIDEPLESEDIRMAMSSLGEDSEHVAVNIPKDLAEQIMKLCAKEDITRSVVFRACIILGLPILESLPGLASTIDPGGKRCPSNIPEGKPR